MLLQKRVVRTKFDIYVVISTLTWQEQPAFRGEDDDVLFVPDQQS